jgi:hypothetical protein
VEPVRARLSERAEEGDLAKVLDGPTRSQVMLGNQAAVIKGGPNERGKLLIQFMLRRRPTSSSRRSDVQLHEGYSPGKNKPWVFDLTRLSCSAEIGSPRQKQMRDDWQAKFSRK